MSITRRNAFRTVAALGAALTIAGAAEAGMPLICHPFDTGKAPLLQWGAGPRDNWNTPDRSYDVRRLTADMLKLLSPDAPVLARMENMRRATIYAAQDPNVATELLFAVMGRALSESSRGSRDSLALFDAGYLIESYRQATSMHKRNIFDGAGQRTSWTFDDEPRGVDGYAFVRRAIELAGSNPEMEYAASLMRGGSESAAHLRRAVAGAPAGSLLARNISR